MDVVKVKGKAEEVGKWYPSRVKPLREPVAGRCHVTGLPVQTRSEWTDVRIGPQTTITLRLIGDSILDITTFGERSTLTQAPLMAFRNRVVAELFPPGHKYVEIYNVANVVGIPPAEVRRQHSLFHISDAYRDCVGVYIYGSNLFLRSIYRTSLALAGSGLWYPFRVVRGYDDAVKAAYEIARGFSSVESDVGGIKDDSFWTQPGWTVATSDGCGEVRFSVGFRRVILMELVGAINDVEVVSRVIEVMESIFRDGHLVGSWHVKISDYSRLESSSMAVRMKYAQELKAHFQRLPSPALKSYVVGASAWVRAAMHFAGRIASLPQALEFLRTREECFKLVGRILFETESVSSGVVDSDDEEFLVQRSELGRLTAMLGSLAWGQLDLESHEGFPEGHPLCELSEAIRLVKGDYRMVLEKHKESERAALAASQAKSDFLANMSHEIRTPLNGVIGMLQLLLQERIEPVPSRYASIALSSAESLLSIVNDILDFSKIEAGRLEREDVIFDLRGCLREHTLMMGLQAKEKGIGFMVEVDEDVPMKLVGDLVRIRQIMSNLVGNAIKFTTTGRIGIAIHAVSKTTDSVRLRFSVEDTGIGIPPEKLESVFESFNQADTSTTRKYGGTGLGLAICRQLVSLLGGELKVESRLGEGSRFWFELDLGTNTGNGHLERADCGALDDSSSCIVQDRGSSFLDEEPSTVHKIAPTRRDARVLVVEDNAVNLKVARSFLGRMGYESDEAENGIVALEKLSEGEYDLVLMDCQMPVMDGFDATRRIRSGEAGSSKKTIPVVALTAAARNSDRDAALLAGMDDYLSKPFSLSALREVVERWIVAGSARRG